MTAVRWKIWYSDGSAWCDEDGPPELGPAENVQLVRYFDPDLGTAEMVYKCDFYYWIDGYPLGGDIYGLLAYLKTDRERSIHGVKQGQQLKPADFQRVLDTALKDQYIPKELLERPKVRVPAGR